jgi:hypothetical protein
MPWKEPNSELGFAVKGGTSSQKSDILLDISNHQINKQMKDSLNHI